MRKKNRNKKHPGEMPIPRAVAADPEAKELVRVWWKGEDFMGVARQLLQEESGICAAVLLVIAGYAADGCRDPVEGMRRIKQELDAQWADEVARAAADR